MSAQPRESAARSSDCRCLVRKSERAPGSARAKRPECPAKVDNSHIGTIALRTRSGDPNSPIPGLRGRSRALHSLAIMPGRKRLSGPRATIPAPGVAPAVPSRWSKPLGLESERSPSGGPGGCWPALPQASVPPPPCEPGAPQGAIRRRQVHAARRERGGPAMQAVRAGSPRLPRPVKGRERPSRGPRPPCLGRTRSSRRSCPRPASPAGCRERPPPGSG